MELNTREKQLYLEGWRVRAVWSYKERTGESLRESVQAVKMYERQLEMDCTIDATSLVMDMLEGINRR